VLGNLKTTMRNLKLLIKYFVTGKKILQDSHYREVQKKIPEFAKSPYRNEIINYLLSIKKNETSYLEIGVRNPDDNFNLIKSNIKYSVDPGIEFESNPVDFKMTSDTFFKQLSDNEILSKDIRFDVIFIDGLHLAEQVERDIENALRYIKDDGFIVLHDCNPPSEWHARENYNYNHTPAQGGWNGTTWKAFCKLRQDPTINSCCINADWGVGILSRSYKIGKNTNSLNPFFEFKVLEENRKEHLNLIEFEDFKKLII